MKASVECVWRAERLLGEGVMWSDREQVVYWIDIKRPAILRFDPLTKSRTIWPLAEQIGCLSPKASGGFIAAMRSGIYSFDLPPPNQEIVMRCLAIPHGHISTDRFNDGTCAPDGSFWSGTMDDAEKQDRGWIYRLPPDKPLQRIAGPYRVCNGPCFSQDGRFAFFSDSARRIIYRLALDRMDLPAERFIELSEVDGYPDGMTIDAQGRLWVAMWDGWCLMAFDSGGTNVGRIDMPVARPTRCAFGGPGLEVLYASSALAENGGAPLAGGLFAIKIEGTSGWAASATFG